MYLTPLLVFQATGTNSVCGGLVSNPQITVLSWAATYRISCFRMGVPGLQFLPWFRGMRCPDPTNSGSRLCHIYWGFLESKLLPLALLAALLLPPGEGWLWAVWHWGVARGHWWPVEGSDRTGGPSLMKEPSCRQAQEGKHQQELLARPPKLRNKSSRAFSPADTHICCPVVSGGNSTEWARSRKL